MTENGTTEKGAAHLWKEKVNKKRLRYVRRDDPLPRRQSDRGDAATFAYKNREQGYVCRDMVTYGVFYM